MKENKIEELKERLEELHRTQDARLACNADDLDIREEIAEAEDEIKELQDDINEKNNNGNDTNVGSIGNSIEEDIKILEELRIANENCIKNAKIKDNPFVAIWEKQNRAIEHILSDYKRVLKENEKLKKDRNNNYQMIALAQNEVLGYMQGYEDGKKLKRSAVACVVENQQYYIIKKEIEHYKEYIEKLQKENEELRNKLLDTLEGQKVIEEETTQYIKENYIPKQKVKDKIEELYQQDRNWSEEMSEPDSNFKNIDRNLKRIKNQIDVLQELIEESEEK